MLCASLAISVRDLLLHMRTLLSLPVSIRQVTQRQDHHEKNSQTTANRAPSELCEIDRTPMSPSPFSFAECRLLDVGHLNVRVRLASGESGVGEAARFTPRPGDHPDVGPLCGGVSGTKELRPCVGCGDVGDSLGFGITISSKVRRQRCPATDSRCLSTTW